jgi:hypothetical protein
MMKSAFVCVAAMMLTTVMAGPASARCQSGWTTLWPKDQLPTQGMIVVDAYGEDMANLDAVKAPGSVVLVPQSPVGGKHNSAPVVMRWWRENQGDKQMRQLVFIPEGDEPLAPGLYTLRAKGLPPQTWRVLPSAAAETATATRPLTWSAPPVVTNSNYQELGCGPSSLVDISIATSALADAVEVNVVNTTEPNKAQSRMMVLPIIDGHISVGQGMCGGAFVFAPGEEVRLRLVAIKDKQLVLAPAEVSFVVPLPANAKASHED